MHVHTSVVLCVSAGVEFSPFRCSVHYFRWRCRCLSGTGTAGKLFIYRLSFVFYVYLFLGTSDISAAPMFDLKCREVTRPIVGEALIIKGERGNLFT